MSRKVNTLLVSLKQVRSLAFLTDKSWSFAQSEHICFTQLSRRYEWHSSFLFLSTFFFLISSFLILHFQNANACLFFSNIFCVSSSLTCPHINAWKFLEGKNRSISFKLGCALRVSREDPGMSHWFQPERKGSAFSTTIQFCRRNSWFLTVFTMHMILVFRVPDIGIFSAWLFQEEKSFFMLDRKLEISSKVILGTVFS